MGLGSELLDWYRDATSLPFDPLLVDLSRRTDDRLRYCTNTGSILSKIISRTNWNSQTIWTMNTQNLTTLQVFQSFSHKWEKLFLQSYPKKFLRFLSECNINLLRGSLQSIKRHHVAEIQSEVRLLSLRRTTWKQKRDILASERGLQLIKVMTPPVINLLFWYGAVCPRSWFCVQQSLITQSVTNQELLKDQPSQNPTYQVDSLKKEINRKFFSKADSLVDKTLSCPRIKLTKLQPLILDGVETGISLFDFAQLLRRKKRRRSRHLLHFTWCRWYISVSDSESECQS